MNKVEIIGLIATYLLLLSMFKDTKNRKGTIHLRLINALACIFFVIYGILIQAHSTWISNGILFFVNIYYLYRAYYEKE